ncbi:hypothetical protein AKJ16_DCAP10694, partial [Drosera capensis]
MLPIISSSSLFTKTPSDEDEDDDDPHSNFSRETLFDIAATATDIDIDIDISSSLVSLLPLSLTELGTGLGSGEEVAELGRLAIRNLSFGGGRGSRRSYDPGFGGETRRKLACRIDDCKAAGGTNSNLSSLRPLYEEQTTKMKLRETRQCKSKSKTKSMGGVQRALSSSSVPPYS